MPAVSEEHLHFRGTGIVLLERQGRGCGPSPGRPTRLNAPDAVRGNSARCAPARSARRTLCGCSAGTEKTSMDRLQAACAHRDRGVATVVAHETASSITTRSWAWECRSLTCSGARMALYDKPADRRGRRHQP